MADDRTDDAPPTLTDLADEIKRYCADLGRVPYNDDLKWDAIKIQGLTFQVHCPERDEGTKTVIDKDGSIKCEGPGAFIRETTAGSLHRTLKNIWTACRNLINPVGGEAKRNINYAMNALLGFEQEIREFAGGGKDETEASNQSMKKAEKPASPSLQPTKVESKPEPLPTKATGSPIPQNKELTSNSDDDKWIKFVDAATLTSINRGTINRAANENEIVDNGKKGKPRRILVTSLVKWAKDRAEGGEQRESEAVVERKMREQGLK